MRFILTILLGVIAGSAMATDYVDVENARQLTDVLRSLQSARDLTDGDIGKVTVSVTTSPKTGQTYSFTFVPTDTGWEDLLKVIQTMVGENITALKTQLQDMSVTGVPE